MVTEATIEVWKRDEQLYDLRTELSFQELHAEDVLATTVKEMLGYISTDRIGSDSEKCLKNLELLNRLLDQNLIDASSQMIRKTTARI